MSDDGAELSDNEVQRLIESQAEDEAERRRAARPLGIQDIVNLSHPDAVNAPPGWDDCWYWCRKHSPEQGPVHSSKECKGAGGYLPTGDLPGDGCVKIGPFMSEAEADRLAGAGQVGMVLVRPPLGMEVEQ